MRRTDRQKDGRTERERERVGAERERGAGGIERGGGEREGGGGSGTKGREGVGQGDTEGKRQRVTVEHRHSGTQTLWNTTVDVGYRVSAGTGRSGVSIL